ncbi:hypothetical protein [Chromohalobacter israelensis]|uniref:hypothetical protein n=1 Tax=Chromohalobacter israelensis TaxID=141390 RepID=UPI00031F4EA4|nr:hypothetical protein [Chromohalobacter salexigens]
MQILSSTRQIINALMARSRHAKQRRWVQASLAAVMMATLNGCPTMADYGAATSGNNSDFVAPHEQFQVDSMDYPVFAVIQDHIAPRSNVNYPQNNGREMPALKENYRWQVTHKVHGEYLIGSESFDQTSCSWTKDGRDHPEHCEPGGIGAEYLDRIYVYPDGSAYAYGYLKNTPRWPHWFGKDETWFRHDDTGDWSGQPWFECVARCDKLKNMSADRDAQALVQKVNKSTAAIHKSVINVDADYFTIRQEKLQVDPMDYPVFAVSQDREAPRAGVSGKIFTPSWFGQKMLPLKKSYRWRVTHKFHGEYLIGSKQYDQANCRQTVDGRDQPEHCEPGGIGAEILNRIYIHPDGSAYAYAFLKNTQRWPPGKQETLLRHDDSGDWSGQPWFECVARCDKLKNMRADP